MAPALFDENNIQSLKETVVRLGNNMENKHDQLQDISYQNGSQVFEKYLEFIASHDVWVTKFMKNRIAFIVGWISHIYAGW